MGLIEVPYKQKAIMRSYHLIFLLLICFSCQKEEHNKIKLESNPYNFGFEKMYDGKHSLPWTFYSREDVKIDSIHSYSGKYSAHLYNSDAERNTGIGYSNSLPIPEKIETITVSCKMKKLSEGIDTFYFLAFSPYKKSTYGIIISDSLSIEQTKDWQTIQLEFPNDTSFHSLQFGLESIGSSDYYIDDFKIEYDGIPFEDLAFYSQQDINLLNSYAQSFGNAPLNEKVDDLAFLAKEVKGKKVIGLGEANHGTREIFQIKSRIVKYLAENEGFNTVVFEENMDNLHLINDYVINETSEKNIEELMTLFKELFQVEEIRDLIVWIKEYNKDKELHDKIFFMGCDMQKEEQSLQYLKDFAKEHDKKLYDLVLACEEEYKVYEDLALIKKVQKQITNRISKLDIPKTTYDRLVQSSMLIEQFIRFDANLGHRTTHRDSCMANNLLWILDQYPDRKAFYWADNHHVKKAKKVMAGGYLDRALGDQYYVIGTTLAYGTTKGRFDDNAELSPRLFPSRREYLLNGLQDSIYFLPLKDIYPTLIQQNESAIYLNKNWEFDLFDAMIHIKYSTASRKLN